MVIELIDSLITDNARMSKELEMAKHTETHLRSAENALMEKDDYIKMLKKALDNRDAKLRAQCERIKALEMGISNDKKVIDSLNKLVVELRTKLEKSENDVSRLNCLLSDSTGPLETLRLRMQVETLKNTLHDLEGALCASSDHSKELSTVVHKILKENA